MANLHKTEGSFAFGFLIQNNIRSGSHGEKGDTLIPVSTFTATTNSELTSVLRSLDPAAARPT